MGQPLVIFKGYESTYDQHITHTAEENFYYSSFSKPPRTIIRNRKRLSCVKQQKSNPQSVIPSFMKVKSFFEETYYPKHKNAIGVSEIPNGKEYYQSRIDFYTTLEMTPRKHSQKGLEEVARIKAKMEAISSRSEL